MSKTTDLRQDRGFVLFISLIAAVRPFYNASKSHYQEQFPSPIIDRDLEYLIEVYEQAQAFGRDSVGALDRETTPEQDKEG